MKQKLLIGLTAGILIFSMAGVTQASLITIASNFGTGDTFNTSYAADFGKTFGDVTELANAFTVPTTFTNVTIKSIEVAIVNPLNNHGGDLINLSLFDDNNGNPGNLLESLDITLDPSSSNRVYQANSTLNTSLISGTQYWLVASAISPNSALAWNWNGIESLFTPTGPSLAYSNNTGNWRDTSGLGQQAFRITGEGDIQDVQVTEPATILLFSAGLAGLAGTKLKRKK